MKEREGPYSETACPGVIFVGRLLLKRTTLYDTMESSSFILPDVDGTPSTRFVFYNKVTCLGDSFPRRYRVITISAIGDVATLFNI